MAIPINEKLVNEDDSTCSVDDPACGASGGTQEAREEEREPTPQTTTEEPMEGGASAGEGIRTIPIPIPTGTGTGASSAATRQTTTAPQTVGRPSTTAAQPGLRNLVRFLKNPQGAMQSTDSAYLRTMYSTDSADLVVKSAMNSTGYF